jgi:hypothetical protein
MMGLLDLIEAAALPGAMCDIVSPLIAFATGPRLGTLSSDRTVKRVLSPLGINAHGWMNQPGGVLYFAVPREQVAEAKKALTDAGVVVW